MNKLDYQIHIAGDQSILVQFGEDINETTNKIVRFLANTIEKNRPVGVNEVILGYTTLLIHYDPLLVSFEKLEVEIHKLIETINPAHEEEHKTIEIPVLYGSYLGPDLKDVANYNNLTEDDVIKIHTKPVYTVYFLGFSPGFPFLGGMSEQIVTPRLANPRTRIRAGSVGIANNQTGIYPVSSPGGWRLIGHTPIALYDPNKKWPFLLSPGDRLKFTSITKRQYESLLQKKSKI